MTVLCDVMMLQLKLLMLSVHNLILVPVTMTTALVDIVFSPGRHGGYFYRALHWGRRAEEVIGFYRPLERKPATDSADLMASRLKTAIAEELPDDPATVRISLLIDRVMEQLRQEKR